MYKIMYLWFKYFIFGLKISLINLFSPVSYYDNESETMKIKIDKN